MTPDYWQHAKDHLSNHCTVMKTMIARYEGEGMHPRADGFYTLIRAVLGQQISVKAADSVWAKLQKAVKPLTPENLLRKREATLRACGLSGSKVVYLRNVAEFFTGHARDAAAWRDHSDAAVIAQLTRIKGIGPWTVEMFLMFHLARPDVLPLKDIGLLNAIDRHCADGKRLKNAEYIEIAEKWRPYRSVATWYLWRSLDPVPVAY
jgi:DNA-3-methyladenine glycosylase II